MYIVASANKPDYKFETYEEACTCAQSMRRDGIIAAIVTSDDKWKTVMTRKHVVSSMSEDDALVVARGITNDYNLDTVQPR